MLKYILNTIMILFVLVINVNAYGDIYSYGDTLKSVVNISSGSYSEIDYVKYYIYLNETSALAGNYIANGTYTLKTGANDPDSILVASWPIPSDATAGIYYFTSVMSYNGSVLKSQTESFRIGPIKTVPADTLGGMGYISQASLDGAGIAIGQIFLPGSVPADNADILLYYNNTTVVAGSGKADASGNYKIWLDATGTYDMEIRYPGFRSGKRTGIVPTVP